MAYFEANHDSGAKAEPKKKFFRKKWLRVVMALAVIIILVGGAMAWKTGLVLNKISSGGILKSIIRSIPGIKSEAKGEADGRINILILGMRGENMPGGGSLAD